MVAITNTLLLLCSFVAMIAFVKSSLFDSFVTDPCENACENKYPSGTYKSALGGCCKRGCRFYSIIKFVRDEDGVNGTLKSCSDNCKNAYPQDTENTSACILGCESQKPFTDHREQLKDIDSSMPDEMERMIYPLLYMHNIYSNMVDKVMNRMCVSWSFFMQEGGGRLIIVKSHPRDMDVQDFDDYTAYKGTSSIMETNIEASDNTATEVLKHSQMKSARSLGDEINAAEVEPWKYNLDDGSNSDWLTCIARKTGVPRLFLCIIILLSAVAMIWLCMSAAVTAPDQKLSQKLSIHGDLEYLRFLPDKKGIKGIHPQDFVEARPLPVKIRIEQI